MTNTNNEDLRGRLNGLEAEVAMQNRTIDDLSDTLREQWEKIDKLMLQVHKLNERLAAAEGDLHTVMPKDRPPPHY